MDENINYLKMIAPVEESNISSRDYHEHKYKNRYLIYNNTLYKVFNQINIGDELIDGENITHTTIMKEIENLWKETDTLWDYTCRSNYK